MSPSTCEKKDFSTSDTTQYAATWRRFTATISFANYPWATVAATPLPVESHSEIMARITPSNEELKRLAMKNPPPDSWLEGEEQRPF